MTDLRIELENKYTYVREGGKQYALRYGEPWRDLIGDNFVAAMAEEIERLYESLDIAYLKGREDGRDRERVRIRKDILQVMLAAAPKPGDE